MFSLSPEINLIKVYQIINDECTFNTSSYYDGELKDYTDNYTLKLSDLIQKVKDYENK